MRLLKAPSTTIFLNKRFFSSKKSTLPFISSKFTAPVVEKNLVELPWFFSGFCDAEANFNILVAKTPSEKGWRVQARFIIELNAKDQVLLKTFRSYLNDIGSISRLK